MPKILLPAILLLAAALRLFDLTSLPNGLHWDEQDTGYQAYSLFKTGKDYFGTPFPLFPHSLADYRTPVFVYSAIPSVALLGLSPLSVRLPSVFWSLLGILATFVLANLLFKNRELKAGYLAILVLALSPWHVQYSRQSVETISLLTLAPIATALFLRGLSQPRYLVLSGLFFGLAAAAYSPGKLFIPLFLLSLVWIYRRRLVFLKPSHLLFSLVLFALVFLPVFGDGIYGKSGMRFRELSIFTDPTTADTVKYRREDLQLSSGVPKTVGMSPRLLDKIVHNKLTVWAQAAVTNYLAAFSTDFLFLKGDRELRHSPSRDNYGMLLVPEILPLLLGLALLFRSINPSAKVVFAWAMLSPISASLTRWDNPHAARLLILLPALVLTISRGLQFTLARSRFLFVIFCAAWFTSAGFTLVYFFNNYRWESAAPFQWGFDQALIRAANESSRFDQVIIDFASDSPLMAHLFVSRFDPRLYQSLQPSPASQIVGHPAYKFSNIFLLPPGSRPWHDLIANPDFPKGQTLLIVSSKNPSIKNLDSPTYTLNYPDTTPAFYFFNVQK